METSKERILKAINHVQPEITPLHIMGFEEMTKWLERFQARDDFDLRVKLGLDMQTARALYRGPNIERGLSIWGTNLDVAGYAGVGYNQVREGHPLAEAASVADIERFTWPDLDEFDYEIVGEVLQAARDKACFIRPQYTVQQGGMTREEAARGGGAQMPKRVTGAWMPILCTMFELFGMEETLIKLHKEPKIIEATIAGIEKFVLEFSHRSLEATRGRADIY